MLEELGDNSGFILSSESRCLQDAGELRILLVNVVERGESFGGGI